MKDQKYITVTFSESLLSKLFNKRQAIETNYYRFRLGKFLGNSVEEMIVEKKIYDREENCYNWLYVANFPKIKNNEFVIIEIPGYYILFTDDMFFYTRINLNNKFNCSYHTFKFAPDEKLISVSEFFISTNKTVYQNKPLSTYEYAIYFEDSSEKDRIGDISLCVTHFSRAIGIFYKNKLMYYYLDDKYPSMFEKLYCMKDLSGEYILKRDYVEKNYSKLADFFEKFI